MPGRAVCDRAPDVVPDPVPLHCLEVPEPNILPFAIGTFDTIGSLSRAEFPHRHTFYEILYVTSGAGRHVIDLDEWPLRPPHLCVVVPGQVHYWEDVTDLHGQVILFNDDFLLAHPDDRTALREFGGRPWLHLDPAAVRQIAPVIRAMSDEYADQAEGVVSVLRAYLHVLITKAGRLHSGPAPDPAPPGGDIVKRFTDLVARPVGDLTVRSYAARLGVSESYLTEAVKSATGRTPGQLIRQARTLEAKRLLASTELSVAQVARATGFADPSYFCRFFRRETGLSPGTFRRGERENHHADRVLSIDPSDLTD